MCIGHEGGPKHIRARAVVVRDKLQVWAQLYEDNGGYSAGYISIGLKYMRARAVIVPL